MKNTLFLSFLLFLCICLSGQQRVHYYKYEKGYDTFYGLVNDEHQKITEPVYDELERISNSKFYTYLKGQSRGILNEKGEEFFESENINYYADYGIAYNTGYSGIRIYNLELKRKIFSTDEKSYSGIPFLLSDSGKFIVIESLGIVLDREGNQLNNSDSLIFGDIEKIEETANGGLSILTYDANQNEFVTLNEKGKVITKKNPLDHDSPPTIYTMPTKTTSSVSKTSKKTISGWNKSILAKLFDQNPNLEITNLLKEGDSYQSTRKTLNSYYGMEIMNESGKFGFANIEGQIILHPAFDDLDFEIVNNTRFVITLNQKSQFTYNYGLYNLDNQQTIFEPIYKYITTSNNGFEVTSENGYTGYYRENGFFIPKECGCL